MADKKASLLITLKDEVSAGIEKLGNGVDSVKAKFNDWKLAIAAAVGVLAGLTAAAGSAIKAYLESETAVNKLNQAMVNQGTYTRAASRDMQEFALAVQSVTTFSDEAVLGVVTLLTQFGLTGEEAKKATKTVLDMSVGLGVDLNAAAMLVGKAFQGSTESLSRYGIKVDENIPKSEKYAAVMDILNSRVGGQATAALNTTAGRLANFGERINDVQERIGKMLVPVLDFFVGKLLVILGAVEQVTGSSAMFERFAATVGGIFIELGKIILSSLISPIQAIAPVFEKMGIDIMAPFESLNAMFDEQIAKLDQWAYKAEEVANRNVQSTLLEEQMEAQSLANRQIKKAQAEQKDTEMRNKRVAAEVKEQLDRQKRWAEEAAAFYAHRKGISKQKIEHLTEMQKLEAFFNSEKVKNTDAVLNQISTLSSARNKQLVAIGKAAAISSATIDTFAGIGKAWALGPILGPPMAALVAAAGFANVAKISGVRLAEGGVVMPRTGGTLATIGEAGKAEAVIPLDDDRAQEKLGGMLGGGGLTVNISAGTIVADPLSVREFAHRIDEELFKMRRNNTGVSQ